MSKGQEFEVERVDGGPRLSHVAGPGRAASFEGDGPWLVGKDAAELARQYPEAFAVSEASVKPAKPAKARKPGNGEENGHGV